MRLTSIFLVLSIIAAMLIGGLPSSHGQGSSYVVDSHTQIVVYSLNLGNNTANIGIFTGLSLLGNWTPYLYVGLKAPNLNCCPFILLEKKGFNGQYSYFVNAKNTTFFNIPLQGAPAYYPFDAYVLSLNFTFPDIGAPNSTIPASAPLIVSKFSPVYSQFNTPNAPTGVWSWQGGNAVYSISFELTRDDWVSWGVLAPVYVIFLLIGLFSLLPLEGGVLYSRLTFQLLMFVVLLGYYATIAPTLPPAPSYLPLVQVLVYAGLTAITTLMAISILTQFSKQWKFTMDSIAVIFSVTWLYFFLYTVLFSNLVIQEFTLIRLFYLQLGIVMLLSVGLLCKIGRWIWHGTNDVLAKAIVPFALGDPPHKIVNWLYATAVCFNLGALLLTVYLVQLYGPGIEVTPLRQSIFAAVQANFAYSGVVNLAISLAFYVGVYFGLKKYVPKLWAPMGTFLFAISSMDFYNDYPLLLLPHNVLLIIYGPAGFLIAGWIGVILMKRMRIGRFSRRGVPPTNLHQP